MKSEDTKKFSEYYQNKRVTGTYDNQREGTSYRKKKRQQELKYFLELLKKNDKEKILELGCSSGFLTKHLGKITAVDTSKDMLNIAYEKNPKAEYIHADMFELPFKKNSFDKIVTMRVWNHLNEEDLRKAIREAKRVLKKNGWLVFDIEEKNAMRRGISVIYKILFRPTGYKIYQYSLAEISKILKEEGFVIEKGKFLKHRIGRQVILQNRLDRK